MGGVLVWGLFGTGRGIGGSIGRIGVRIRSRRGGRSFGCRFFWVLEGGGVVGCFQG